MNVSISDRLDGGPLQLVSQLYGGVHGALRVVLDGPLLDVGVDDPPGRAPLLDRLERRGVEGAAFEELAEEAHLALEGHVRPRKAFARQQTSEDGVADRPGRRRALPHRQLPRPRLPHGRMGHDGDRDGVGGLSVVQSQEVACPARGAYRRIHHVVPPVRADAGGVAQRDSDLVGDRRAGDEVARGPTPVLAQRHQAGQRVARVKRLQRQVCIVVVQVSDHHPVGKGRGFRGDLCAEPPEGRAVGMRER